MFPRRVLSTSTPLLLRPFSTSAAHSNKLPSLADIRPGGAEAFEARKQEFRKQQKVAHEARRKAEQSQSAQNTPSSPEASTAQAASDASASGIVSGIASKLSIGSLSSSAATTSAAAATDASGAGMDGPEGSRPKRALSNLIYGTKEGQQMDQDIERSFSQVLARGKYVHSIVFHKVKPDKVDEYVKLVGNWYPRMAGLETNHVHLVGSWRTEVGDCDTFVHIWEYQRYQGYHASLNSIASHPDHPAFDKALKELITEKRTSLMQEFSFWNTAPPRKLGGLFELRSYTLHPGTLQEWETHWRQGLKARREVMEGVGAWFVQIGELNTVHHLWQFADLEERRLRREQSWNVTGWGETVHKTVPLIQTMKSRILIPMSWSPTS